MPSPDRVPRLALRFDMRNRAPDGSGSAELYAAALDLAGWADGLGFGSVQLLEHHGSADGYLPSPLTMAAAIAGRTRSVRLDVVVAAPFYHPVRLAEDLAVLDLVSGGRVDVTVVAGYVEEEFRLYGVDPADRPALVAETIGVLRAAWAGKPVERDGVSLRVTPWPLQPGGPRITMGGSTPRAARRAAALADRFAPTAGHLWDVYSDACAAAGRPPGPRPLRRGPSFLHVSEDPERDWARIGPYALHSNESYAAWTEAVGLPSPFRSAPDVAALRASGQFAVVTPQECLDLARGVDLLVFNPIVGGMPPELGWEGMRLFESAVLPALTT